VGSFPQDPSDGLVVGVLDVVGAWKAWPTLPDVLALYRCYPDPARRETGAVTDLDGTNASARATWIVLFGHPEKQRARPDVVKGLRRALESVTGTAFADPESLDAYLKRPEVAALVAGKKPPTKRR